MAGTKKINKSKKAVKETVQVNSYEVIAGDDGNPNSPAEFDADEAYDGELFFKADDDAVQEVKNKVLILNFIHKELKHATERVVPALDVFNGNPNVEVYHRAKFQGVELDVCVYWPPRAEGDFKNCIALVKFTTDDLSEEHASDGIISTDAAWNAEAKADTFTLKNDALVMNYWAPRWKYVVNALRKTAYNRFEKNGAEKPPEPEPVAEVVAEVGDLQSQEEKEELMSVYVGSTGKIIGPKGAKIQEIKKASNVTDIKMPPKTEGGDRPKARDPVDITIIGKPRAIAKAREMIQEVVNEWVNAPRQPKQDYQAPEIEYPTPADVDNNLGDSNGWENNAGGGGNGTWDTTTAGANAGGAETGSQWGAAPADNW